MSNLPLVNVPSSTMQLKVANKKIRVKAFTMKTMKNMSVISEAGDSEDILFAVKNIVSNSVIEPANFDTGKLGITDITAIFLKLVELSKGPEIQIRYKCRNKIDDVECNTPIEVVVDISKYEYTGDVDKKRLVELNENVGITFHYPSIDDVQNAENLVKEKGCPEIVALASCCIDDVYHNKKEVAKDWSLSDLADWVWDFPSEILTKIDEKIGNSPIIKKDIKIVCPKCGTTLNTTLSSLEDFFGSGFRGIR